MAEFQVWQLMEIMDFGVQDQTKLLDIGMFLKILMKQIANKINAKTFKLQDIILNDSLYRVDKYI